MADERQSTLADKWLASLKNRPVVACIVVTAGVVIGLASFTEAVNKLKDAVGLNPPKPLPQIVLTEFQRLQSTAGSAPKQIEASSQTNPQNSPVIQGNNNSPVIQGNNNSPVIQGNNNVINQNIEVVPRPVESTKPATDRSRLLAGTWKGTLRQSSSTYGEVIATGYTRLSESGAYSFSGEVALRTPNDGKPMESVYLAQAAGTWQLNDDKYEVTLSGITSQPKLFRKHGEPDFDQTRLTRLSLLFPNLRMPKLEDMIPLGSRQEYEIVELTQSKLQARGKGIRGSAISYESTRQ